MLFLKGGNWDEGTYASSLKVSMKYTEEMPNVLKLASPYGALKSLVKTHIELSIATREAIKEGKIIPLRCWDQRAIP